MGCLISQLKLLTKTLSFMATTLTITKISLLIIVSVEYDGETRDKFQYNMDPCKLIFFSSRLMYGFHYRILSI